MLHHRLVRGELNLPNFPFLPNSEECMCRQELACKHHGSSLAWNRQNRGFSRLVSWKTSAATATRKQKMKCVVGEESFQNQLMLEKSQMMRGKWPAILDNLRAIGKSCKQWLKYDCFESCSNTASYLPKLDLMRGWMVIASNTALICLRRWGGVVAHPAEIMTCRLVLQCAFPSWYQSYWTDDVCVWHKRGWECWKDMWTFPSFSQILIHYGRKCGFNRRNFKLSECLMFAQSKRYTGVGVDWRALPRNTITITDSFYGGLSSSVHDFRKRVSQSFKLGAHKKENCKISVSIQHTGARNKRWMSEKRKEERKMF